MCLIAELFDVASHLGPLGPGNVILEAQLADHGLASHLKLFPRVLHFSRHMKRWIGGQVRANSHFTLWQHAYASKQMALSRSPRLLDVRDRLRQVLAQPEHEKTPRRKESRAENQGEPSFNPVKNGRFLAIGFIFTSTTGRRRRQNLEVCKSTQSSI